MARPAAARSLSRGLPPTLEVELRSRAPEILDQTQEAARHYAGLATGAANGLGRETALRVAAAATLMESALIAHGTAPRLSAEALLRADFHLALAAEILAQVGQAAIQQSLAEAAMEIMAAMGAAADGLPTPARSRLGQALLDGFRAGMA